MCGWRCSFCSRLYFFREVVIDDRDDGRSVVRRAAQGQVHDGRGESLASSLDHGFFNGLEILGNPKYVRFRVIYKDSPSRCLWDSRRSKRLKFFQNRGRRYFAIRARDSRTKLVRVIKLRAWDECLVVLLLQLVVSRIAVFKHYGGKSEIRVKLIM